MASNKAQETVVERRLRPVYDALDSGNNKKATQEADKLLKKHPNLHCAKALKALALCRLSRVDDATTLLDELTALQLTDDSTLQALTHSYKELGQSDKIATIYEAATAKVPRSENLMTHQFMAYVRLGQFKKQQLLATQLFQEFQKTSYYLWRVISVFMQAMSDAKLGDTMLLPLAEKMLLKHQETNDTNEAEVKFLLEVLVRRENYVQALNILQGPLAEQHLAMNMLDRNYRIIELLCKLGRHEEIVNVCLSGLQTEPDDWTLYKNLIASTFILIECDQARKSELLSKVSDCVLDKVTTKCHLRGPHLARLKLIVGLLERDLVVRADLGDPTSLLLDYARRFGHKPCCFLDIKPYLCLLGEGQRQEFLDSLTPIVGIDVREATSEDVTKLKFCATTNQVQQHVCAVGLRLALADYLPASRLAFAKQLIVRFWRSYTVEDIDESVLEIRPGDFYMVMAVQLMWSVYLERGDLALLNEMILCLELGIEKSPTNFHFKILLAHLYAMVGAGQQVLNVCQSLDLKYVLRDTLGYLTIDQLSTYGLFTKMIMHLLQLNHYYASSERELLECLISSYKNAAYPQIIEFNDYYNRSMLSIHKVACEVSRRFLTLTTWCHDFDSMKTTLLTAGIENPLLDTISWTSLTDNRNFRVVPCWENDDDSNDEEIKRRATQSFKEMVDFMKLKQLLLRCFAALCLECDNSDGGYGNGSSNGVLPASGKESNGVPTTTTGETNDLSSPNHPLRTLTGKLKAHYQHCRSTYCEATTPSLRAPAPSNFNLFLQGGYMEVIDCLFDVAYLMAAATRANDDTTQQLITPIDCALQTLRDDHSPDRIRALPTVDQLQQLLKRAVRSHQLFHVGTQSPPYGSQATDGDRSATLTAGQFPFLQLCHISWLVQMLSVSVLVCVAVKRLLTPHADVGGSAKRKKKSRRGGAASSASPSQSSSSATSVVSSCSDSTTSCDPSNVKAVLLTHFNELSRVIADTPVSIAGLVTDLETLLTEFRLEALSLSPSVGAQPHQEGIFVDIGDQLLADNFALLTKSVGTKLRDSYEASIKELLLVVEHVSSVAKQQLLSSSATAKSAAATVASARGQH